MINKHYFLKNLFLILGVGILPLYAAAQNQKNDQRPNIILVMLDDAGWADVGFTGCNDIVKTPELDKMAKDGLIFNRFYAASAVCSPTRGSCLTGRNPYRYGVYTYHLPLKHEEITLPEILKDAGYRTGHFGKWHLGDIEKGKGKYGEKGVYGPPGDHGFEKWYSIWNIAPTWDPYDPKNFLDALNQPNKDTNRLMPDYRHYYDNGKKVLDSLTGSTPKIIMDHALDFMENSHNKKSPFFCVIWFNTIHTPIIGGPQYLAMYKGLDPQLQTYYAAMTAMDHEIGRLRKSLRNLGIEQNTLIMFTSDNGPKTKVGGSAGPFRGEKRSLYEGGVRMPSLAEWPGKIIAGTSTSYPSVTSDYLPTILDILNLSMPDDRPLDGTSLLPVLLGKEQSLRPSPIGFQYSGQQSWTDNQYKLYRADQEKARFELYDLLNDPYEKKDISDKYPKVVERMKKELEAWVESCRNSDSGADYPQTTDKL
ncbi:MAG: sulfatase-like hydrolase/transferase [Bacteroidales bacterium]|nr:sulfatase-like hydrolase/transferase [Bacteroidales bacterium]